MSLLNRIFRDVVRIPDQGNRKSAPSQVPRSTIELAYVIMSARKGGGNAPHRFGSAVAVFESPLDAKQTARLHTRSGLSATDRAVETAVTRPQATTAPTVARGRRGGQWPTGAGTRTGDAVNPLTSLLPRNI